MSAPAWHASWRLVVRQSDRSNLDEGRDMVCEGGGLSFPEMLIDLKVLHVHYCESGPCLAVLMGLGKAWLRQTSDVELWGVGNVAYT